MKKVFIICITALICSCNEKRPSNYTVKDTTHGIAYSIEHTSGPALSQSEDRVYAGTGNRRELIFEGYGARRLTIKPLHEGVVVIEYCGGSIEKVSSFLANRTSSGNALAVKVQPVVIANVAIGGNRICSE